MNASDRLKSLLAAGVAAAAVAMPASALEEVPYVPTPQVVVDKILSMGRVGPKDYLIDLGSGDGRIVVTAAKRLGARGFGVDWSEQLVEKARALAAAEGVAERAQFFKQDIFETDISKATVVTTYLLPDTNLALRPRFLDILRPGTRIVAHDYDLGDWRPDERVRMAAPGKTVGPLKESEVFMWVVPAKVGGRWQGTLGAGAAAKPLVVDLEQRFQDLTVRATLGGAPLAMKAEPVRGDRLVLTFDSQGLAQRIEAAAQSVPAGELAGVLQGTIRPQRNGAAASPLRLTRVPG